MMVHETLFQARDLAVGGHYDDALQAYQELLQRDPDVATRAQIANDQGVIAAVLGEERRARVRFRHAQAIDPNHQAARENGRMLDDDDAMRSSLGPTRVVILSLLFNWPSTGGGTIHTFEFCRFLAGRGYDVRHLFARNPALGVGRVTDCLGYPHDVLDFDKDSWTAESVRERFRQKIAQFDPDWVIITDSWNSKPLLAEAAEDYPFFLRIAALECLCPLNNVRLLLSATGSPVQCDNHQLHDAIHCQRCVHQNGRLSGALHHAERALSQFAAQEYPQRLRSAFADAEGVLVVNPTIAEAVRPHARSVHVIPSGFDATRFPCDVVARPRAAEPRHRILFAGLVEEMMKGFHVLLEAGERLWARRQDFEILATADPPGIINPYTRFIGWQSQDDLPRAIQDADILVFPTIAQEALGRSAVEAMGCGRPVIASRIGGLPWVVDDDRSGLLFEPGDVADLCRQLERLLDEPSRAEELGRAGRDKFEREFTWDVVIRQHYLPLLGLPSAQYGPLQRLEQSA